MSVEQKVIGIDQNGIKLLSLLKIIDYRENFENFDIELDNKLIYFEHISIAQSFDEKTFNPNQYNLLILGTSELYKGELKKTNTILSLLKFKHKNKFKHGNDFPRTLCGIMQNYEVAMQMIKDKKLRQFDAYAAVPGNESTKISPEHKSEIYKMITEEDYIPSNPTLFDLNTEEINRNMRGRLYFDNSLI